MHIQQTFKLLLGVFLGLIVLTLPLGCGGGTRGTETGDPIVRYSGVIVDKQGQPVQKLDVLIDQVRTETNGQGYFELQVAIKAGDAPLLTISSGSSSAETVLNQVTGVTEISLMISINDSQNVGNIEVSETVVVVSSPTPTQAPSATATPLNGPTAIHTPTPIPSMSTTATPTQLPTMTPTGQYFTETPIPEPTSGGESAGTNTPVATATSEPTSTTSLG